MSQNGLDFEKEALNSDWIMINSIKNEHEIKNLYDGRTVRGVTTLYTLTDQTLRLTVSDKITLKIFSNVGESQIRLLASKHNLQKIDRKWLGENVFQFKIQKIDEKLIFQIANEIYESGLVEFSHPDFLNFDVAEVNDEFRGSQWNLNKILIDDAWNITTGDASIIIAIIDNGVQSNHPDLSVKFVAGYNTINENSSAEPTYGRFLDYHGTACAGIAAAYTNNGEGIAGVGYNCKLMAVKWYHYKTANEAGGLDATTSNAAEAINWAWDHGASIINCSWNCNQDASVTNAINSATSSGRNGKGCVVVKSSGNYGTITFPGTLPNVITVGMTNQFDNRINDETGESGSGAELDVMAPSKVYATDLTGSNGKTTGNYIENNFTGTSAAAPHVSGLAGLILSVDNSLTEQRVREIICYTADDKGPAGWDQNYGWGRINAYNAVRSAARQFTLSGTLQNDELWWGTINITGNVTVPSGKRLTILSGTIINFSGSSYITVQAGGTMIATGTVTFNPTDRGVRYNGTMTTNNTWGFPVLVTGNLTVNAGQTLTILKGTTVKFNTNKKLIFNGIIAADGTSSQPINFQASSSSWYGIEMNASATGSISYSTIQDAACGIRLYATAINIEHCNFHNNVIGIKYENQGSGFLRYNQFENLNAIGIECVQYSAPSIRSYNRIWDHAYGVKADNTSLPDVGNYAGQGYNCICNLVWDIYSTNSTAINAQYNWWGSASPSPALYGNIVWQPYLNYDPVGGSLRKNPAKQENQNTTVYSQNTADTTGVKEFETAYQFYLKDDFNTAMNLFQTVITNYPDSPVGLQALSLVDRCLELVERSGEITSILERVIDSHPNQEIAGLAKSIFVKHYVKSGSYSKAISYSQQILKEFPEKNFAKYALYDLGTIYWYFQHDPKTGEKYYRQLIETWPKDGLAQSALATLGEAT
ncbi:S8 family serine peptidase, partial [candidate division KSB1 bacterium]|nr:S8 family serine peptidase [candidate division KSB1 bacterium]